MAGLASLGVAADAALTPLAHFAPSNYHTMPPGPV